MKTSSDRTADTALPTPATKLGYRSRRETERVPEPPLTPRHDRWSSLAGAPRASAWTTASRATHLRTGHHAIRTRVGVAASALDLACRLEPDGLAGSESGGLQDVEIDPRACTVGLADRPQDIAPVGQARLAVVGHHASFDT
jgi:hypothetical protein